MSQKGNKNALKHGAYAKEIVLPKESAEGFEQLHQAFRVQFNPDGGAEEAIVRQLAGTQWQNDRLEGWLCRAYDLAEHVAPELGQSPLDMIVRLLKTSNDHNVDVILKLREQLDRSFDKGVQRLANMKEFKKLYGAKPIELPKAEPTSIAPVETDGDTAKDSENAEKSKTGKRHAGGD